MFKYVLFIGVLISHFWGDGGGGIVTVMCGALLSVWLFFWQDTLTAPLTGTMK